MSKSYKKNSIFGHGGGSEKSDKRIANRRLRHLNRIRINNDEEPLDMYEVSDEWMFRKDGKGYWHPDEDDEYYEYYEKGMRK